MIHLDTHVVVWLYAGHVERFPESVRRLLDDDPLAVSPAVLLELQYLYEVGRVSEPASAVWDDLMVRLGLRLAEADFDSVVFAALPLGWTRDPFDRLIVAHALADDARLLTADRTILEHTPAAFWAE